MTFQGRSPQITPFTRSEKPTARRKRRMPQRWLLQMRRDRRKEGERRTPTPKSTGLPCQALGYGPVTHCLL